VFYIRNTFASKKVALKTLYQDKKELAEGKIAKNLSFFLEPKIGKLQCTHLKCTILKLFAPNLLANPIACVFHLFAAG
jgi:hypothetical protein